MIKPTLAFVALGIVLAACTLPSGAKFSSEHGYGIQGKIGGERGLSGSGIPTIVPNEASPMGSRKNNPDGSVDEDMYSTIIGRDGSSATGPAAIIVAETRRLEQLILLCAVAPAACSGDQSLIR